MKRYDYKPIKVSPSRWFKLENFPFIEEDFDSLTSYGFWCKLKDFFDLVASNTNDNGMQVKNLTDAFINLKTYVDNYLNADNLIPMMQTIMINLIEQGIVEVGILYNAQDEELRIVMTRGDENNNG